MKKRINPLYFINPAYYFYKLLTGTLRYKEVGREKLDAIHAQNGHMVFCLWHAELLPLIKMQRQFDIVTLVSPSKDGSFLSAILQKLGLRTVRGSSTRQGASALLSAAKLMKEQHIHACITVDGPKGPRHQVKEGALFLANYANAYLVPIRIDVKWAYKFRTWDKFKFPLPFSEVIIHYGEPYFIEKDISNTPELQQEKEKLQNLLIKTGNMHE